MRTLYLYLLWIDEYACRYSKSFVSVETYPTLLKRDLRRNLFILFAGWSGGFGRSLASALTGGTPPSQTAPPDPPEEEEQQFCALQVCSASLTPTVVLVALCI